MIESLQQYKINGMYDFPVGTIIDLESSTFPKLKVIAGRCGNHCFLSDIRFCGEVECSEKNRKDKTAVIFEEVK